MRIERATASDVAYVALRMREADFRELSALSWAQSREDLADGLAQRYAAQEGAIVAAHGAEPVAVGALVEHRPNVVTLAFFATDTLPKIGGPLTRFIRNRLFKPVKTAGAHRIEAVSMVGHHAAHRWIEALGLTLEAVCHGYGRGGEDYLQFAWVRDDVRTPCAG